jgi:hypothetical protein
MGAIVQRQQLSFQRFHLFFITILILILEVLPPIIVRHRRNHNLTLIKTMGIHAILEPFPIDSERTLFVNLCVES